MRCHIARHRVDPVLAPDQFSVARPLRPEDLDKRVTRQGVYPSLPAPNGIHWSEYMKTHSNKPRSISSSTEALESDHARFVTRMIAQHARMMATHTRLLPTDSPIPFLPIERRHMSEGSLKNVPPYGIPSDYTINIGGIDYHSEITETDRVSTFTGLDDYDTLFAAKHGRGALDSVPNTAKMKDIVTTSISTSMVGPVLIDRVEKSLSIYDDADLHEREQMRPLVTSPKPGIIGEGAAVFTDMTETILDALDKQVNASPGSQQLPIEKPHKGDQESLDSSTPGMGLASYNQNEAYPDLFLPIRENYRISDHFCGHAESLSVDNNPVVLVELDNLSCRYGTSLYAVDRVNGTMYGKFSIGYRMIPEKAMVIPQYQQIPTPVYENTLPGITGLPTPIAKSTPITCASHMPTVRPERDILQPIASKEARAAYLEEHMKNIGSVHLPSNNPAKVEETGMSTDLMKRIDMFCNEQKEKWRQERESHERTLVVLQERKRQQPVKEDDKVVYSQIAQNMEKTRDVIRRSMSRASTISAEERQMVLTEREFTMIKQKMDKIDHHLHEMYKNWHAEYGNGSTLEVNWKLRTSINLIWTSMSLNTKNYINYYNN